jgi:hypothetical protein
LTKVLKLEEILNSWDQDTEIDRTELGEESRKIAKLHAKYLRIRSTENLRLVQLQGQLKELRLQKHEFYTLGPTKETAAKGWTLPAKGIVLKSDLPLYMDADKDIIAMNLKVAYQAEIVAALDMILKAVQGRNWEIGRMLDWQKFIQGG